MSPEKLVEREKTLSGIERKVLYALSSAAASTASQVYREIRRSTGSSPELRLVGGTLRHLVSLGLAKEHSGGYFVRVTKESKPEMETAIQSAFRNVFEAADQKTRGEEKGAVVEQSNATPQLSAPTPEKDDELVPSTSSESILSLLADVAAEHRSLAQQHQALAEKVDDVALKVASSIERYHADQAIIDKLRESLKGLGIDVPSRLSLPAHPPKQVAFRKAYHRIPESVIEEVKRQAALGIGEFDLMRRFGLSRSSISRIVSGKR